MIFPAPEDGISIAWNLVQWVVGLIGAGFAEIASERVREAFEAREVFFEMRLLAVFVFQRNRADRGRETAELRKIRGRLS